MLGESKPLLEVALELASKIEHVTPILVVSLRICPDVRHFFLERVPVLEVRDAGWLLTPVLTLCPFLKSRE